MKKTFLVICMILILITCSFGIEGETINNDKYVPIEGATFSMGDTKDVSYDNDDKPIHEVTLTYDYYMGKYEVTNEEYCSFLNDIGADADGSKDEKELTDMYYSQIEHDGTNFYVESGKDNYPMMEVTWLGAIYFCNWLSEKEGLKPAYDIATGEFIDYPNNKGYRLPTEAEWEYAARGATNNPDYLYSGSDNLYEVGWYEDNSENETHEVGTKNPNGIEIYDMSGNVWEWCNDWYNSSYYASSPSQNPAGPVNGSDRVLRGGSMFNSKKYCHITRRDYYSPTRKLDRLGFRVCRTK